MSIVDDAAPRIAAACADPGDDAPRRELARWLSDRGHMLGRFMTRQLDRNAREAATLRPAPTPDDDERADLASARRAWIDLAPALAALRGRGGGVGFELVRGMAGAVRVTWEDLRQPAWLAAAPLEHLDVLGVMPDDGLELMRGLPALRQLRSLALEEVGLTDSGANELAAMPWPRLRWLDLTSNRIGRTGGEVLAASRSLPVLAIATLAGNADTPTELAYDAGTIGEVSVAADIVLERSMSPWAEAAWRRSGEPPWQRVLWRRGREIPHRWCMWDGLTGVDCGGADLDGAVLLRGRLERVRAAGARWRDANLAASALDDVDVSGGDLSDVHLAFGALFRVRAARASAPGISLDQTRVTDCDFSDADLRNARFAGAVVTGCSFRNAQLGCADGQRFVGRTRGARFIGCDFRGADVGGREFFDVEMIDCKLGDVRGTPWRVEGSVGRRIDRSADGSGADVVSEAPLGELLGGSA
ncbi:MAG: pentapeptide repeat-containing protein [Deltaproteobacteria bacterium]|nr:pentapeptide repeat-containing protein [Kofleriaceae bacterium]